MRQQPTFGDNNRLQLVVELVMECMPTFWESADIAPETRLLRAANTRYRLRGKDKRLGEFFGDVPECFPGLRRAARLSPASISMTPKFVGQYTAFCDRMNTPTVIKKTLLYAHR